MATRYDLLSFKEYKNAQGEQKTYSVKVGSLFPLKEGRDGFSIQLDAYPIAGTDGKVRMTALPPRPREEKGTDHNGRTSNVDGSPIGDANEDAPF